MQCGGIPRHTPLRARYTNDMSPRYIRAPEVGSFAFCRRAWFLERQNQPTDLTEAPEAAAGRSGRGRAPRKLLSTERVSLLLLVLGIGGLVWVALLALQP